jgi:cob(I)alamin adenosyltransferase
MSHLIHSQAGQLATQRLKSQTLQQSLQEELAVSQDRIMKQEKEIQWLKKYVLPVHSAVICCSAMCCALLSSGVARCAVHYL